MLNFGYTNMLCSGLRAWSFVSSLSILTECRTAVQRSQKFDTSQLCQNNYSLDAGLPIHGHVRRHVEHLRGEALCREGRELVLEVAGVGLQRELVQGHLFGLLFLLSCRQKIQLQLWFCSAACVHQTCCS